MSSRGEQDLTAIDRAELATIRLYSESGWTETEGAEGFETPLSELVRADEQDQKDFETLRREEIERIRMETLVVFLRHLIGAPDRDPDLLQIGTRVAVAAQEAELPPFDSMTYGDIGALKNQGRAAINEVHKKVIGKGSDGRKPKRSKSETVKKKLAASAGGNTNRSTAKAKELLKQSY